MMTFVINFVLFVASFFFASKFTVAIMGESEMGYSAPFWSKIGFCALIWVSQLMASAIIIMITDLFVNPFWYNFQFSWLGVTTLFSFICFLSTLIPEQKEEIPENRVVGITAPAACPPVAERIFWNRDLGLYILESIQAMDDAAVCKLYYDSKEKMYALDDSGHDWSYMLHVNSIAFIVAMDRKLHLIV